MRRERVLAGQRVAGADPELDRLLVQLDGGGELVDGAERHRELFVRAVLRAAAAGACA